MVIERQPAQRAEAGTAHDAGVRAEQALQRQDLRQHAHQLVDLGVARGRQADLAERADHGRQARHQRLLAHVVVDELPEHVVRIVRVLVLRQRRQKAHHVLR